MFFRRPFYVPTRVQSKQAEISVQRLPTEGEVYPDDMAVCPVGKVWGGVSFVIVGNTKKKGEILIKTEK